MTFLHYSPLAFAQYNCLLDECTAVVGAIVVIISITSGLVLGYDIAAALHNERLIIRLLADAGSTVRCP